jgi:hypothetical protein
MSFDFSSVADDFFVNLNVQTTLALPNARETVLHFCEAVQKEFSQMTCFYQRETGEHVLEGDRDSGSYQWMELQGNRLSAGYFNPPNIAEAYRLHKWLLDRSVYYLGVSGLDVEALDVLLGFNLDYQGNRDAIVAQALLGNSPLASLTMEGPGKAIEFEPSLVVALDEDCCLQARLSVETRSSSYQVRTGQYDDEPISVYFAVRRYPIPGKVVNVQESFARQCELCEEITRRVIVPQVVEPISAAIATGG